MARNKNLKKLRTNRQSSGDDYNVASKNANGEGSFFKTVTRGRTHWRGYVYASDGTPVRVCSVDHKTRNQAKEAAAKKLDKYEGSLAPSITPALVHPIPAQEEPKQIWTLAEYCASNDSTKELVGSTERRYAKFQALMLDEKYGVQVGTARVAIGRMLLEFILMEHVREWLGSVRKDHGKNKVDNLKIYVAEHLEMARSCGHIKGNPAKYRQQPGAVQIEPTKVAETLLEEADDSERFRSLLSECTDPSVGAALVLMVHGVRWSEIIGLTWDRMRGDKKVFIGQQLKHCYVVREGVRDEHRSYTIAPRKAGAAGYWIELSDAEFRFLVDASERAVDVPIEEVDSKERLVGQLTVRFVVCNRDGGRYPEQTLRRHIKELEAKVNAAPQNPHAYRHDMVSFAATEEVNGLPGAGASVGHRNLQTTGGYVQERKKTKVGLKVHRQRSKQLGFVD